MAPLRTESLEFEADDDIEEDEALLGSEGPRRRVAAATAPAPAFLNRRLMLPLGCACFIAIVLILSFGGGETINTSLLQPNKSLSKVNHENSRSSERDDINN